MMKINLAEKGIFNKPGLTPIESVEKENLHNVLFEMNVQAMRNEEIEKEHERRSRKKS